jgi:hypothetical protein
MLRLTARVQLYGEPKWRDYEGLHAAMKKDSAKQSTQVTN